MAAVVSADVLKLVAFGATFIAITLGFALVLTGRKERVTVRSALGSIVLEDAGHLDKRAAAMSASFATRVIGPGISNLAGLVYRFGPVGLAEQTRQRFVLAGLSERWTPDVFFALSAVAPLITGSALYFYGTMAKVPWPMWIFVPASALFPKTWLTKKVEARQHAIRLALADTLDLLTISVEAGLGFDAALGRVVSSVPGPLSDELYRTLQELRIGIPRNQAFQALSDRTQVLELDQFITAMNQADSFGVSVGNVLRVQADQLRKRRSEIAEERAAKTPVKLLFPLLVCIFPGLFTVLVGPAALRIMDNVLGKW